MNNFQSNYMKDRAPISQPTHNLEQTGRFLQENHPIYQKSKLDFIKIGLDYYFNKKYVESSHILIPQIEDLFRVLIEMSGGAIYKSGRYGGLFLKTLDELLRDDIISNVFNDETSEYFRIILTDQRGWNIRNNICHGITNVAYFNIEIADRIFHVLLLLAQIRNKEV